MTVRRGIQNSFGLTSKQLILLCLAATWFTYSGHPNYKCAISVIGGRVSV